MPYWYPGCSWQPACSVYLLLNNYFLQVKCSLVFKSALYFTKITVHLFRQLSNLTVIPATDVVFLLLHQRQRSDKRALLVLFKAHIWAIIFIFRIIIWDWRTSAPPVSEEVKHDVVYKKVKHLLSTKGSLFYLPSLFLVQNDHQFRRFEMLIWFIPHAKALLESKAAQLLQLTTHKSVQPAAIPYWISLSDCGVCFQVRSGPFTFPGWQGPGQWTVSNPEEQSSLSPLLPPHKSKWSPVSTSPTHVSTMEGFHSSAGCQPPRQNGERAKPFDSSNTIVDSSCCTNIQLIIAIAHNNNEWQFTELFYLSLNSSVYLGRKLELILSATFPKNSILHEVCSVH